MKILKEQLLDFDVVLLEIPVNPTEALPLFGRLCMDEVPDIIVGINMGVMYTQLLREYKCICFNPDLKKSGKLPFIGVNEYSKFHNSVANHFEIISQFHHYTEKDRHQFGGKGDCAQLINDETIFIELYKLRICISVSYVYYLFIDTRLSITSSYKHIWRTIKSSDYTKSSSIPGTPV